MKISHLIIIYKDNIIKITSPEKKNNQKIKLNSIIELNPFYLNGEIIFEEKKVNFIIDEHIKFNFQC